jgi:hypothetical protein
MTLRFDVTEVDRVIDLSTIGNDSSEEFTLLLEAGSKKSGWILLFDRTEPDSKGRWNVNSQTKDSINLNKDSEMDIEFLTQDNLRGSGLKSGKIWWSGQKDGPFDAKHELNWKSSAFQGEGKTGIRFSVDTKSLENFLSEFWIHIATTDRAGNQQLNHPPLRINWSKTSAPTPSKTP